MDNNGILQKHWLNVTFHFLLDVLIFTLAFVIGADIRFEDHLFIQHLSLYSPSIVLGALVFSAATYIFGLYSPQNTHKGIFERALIIGLCLIGAACFLMGFFYVNFSSRIGRGVMLLSAPIAYSMLLLHHALLLHYFRNFRERVAFIVTADADYAEAQMFQSLDHQQFDFVGVIQHPDWQPQGNIRVLGRIHDLPDIVRRDGLVRVLCTNASINDRQLSRLFCQLRFSGVTVMPLITVCEEVYQCAPLAFVTPEWLLSASGSPHMLYIRKIKRGFDIAASLLGLVLLGPFLLLGMGLVKVTSRGPAFYRQLRCGRFGKPFEVVKLRTMAVDAERDGPVWASENDPRVTLAGKYLRKYRIDEIPQLLNILRGEMSFVGPRPERPEFIEQLAEVIPFYKERLMVQPGLTGWAQVNYPYGASVEDTQRKLEFDLYYMKHMSVFLDLFVLLDTIRIILRGGAGEHRKQRQPRSAALREIDRYQNASVLEIETTASVKQL